MSFNINDASIESKRLRVEDNFTEPKNSGNLLPHAMLLEITEMHRACGFIFVYIYNENR